MVTGAGPRTVDHVYGGDPRHVALASDMKFVVVGAQVEIRYDRLPEVRLDGPGQCRQFDRKLFGPLQLPRYR